MGRRPAEVARTDTTSRIEPNQHDDLLLIVFKLSLAENVGMDSTSKYIKIFNFCFV